METLETYQYRKLKGIDPIRLVILQPNLDRADQIRCTLLHTSLTDCEEDVVDHYVAISYVWGDSLDTVAILVDGKSLNITTNLASALRDIRQWDREVRVWCDAICINQNDVEERSSQVRMMGSIYACAQHTIIYFHEAKPETKLLLAALRVSNANRRKGAKNDFSVASLRKECRLTAVHDMLSHPWFTRVWILQEFLFSRDPWIQCGSSRVRWEDFYAFISSERAAELRKLSRASKSLSPIKSNAITRAELNSSDWSMKKVSKGREILLSMTELHVELYERKAQGHQHFLKILSSRRGLGATDPRDSVFAHLEIARMGTDPYSHLIEVDYNRDCGTVFGGIAEYFMKQNNSLSILSMVEDFPLEHRRSGKPSWAPDWTSPVHSLRRLIISEWDYGQRSSECLYIRQNRETKHVNLSVKWGVVSEKTTVWTNSTLACVGVHVSNISVVGKDIVWPRESGELRDFIHSNEEKWLSEVHLEADQYLALAEILYTEVAIELGIVEFPDIDEEHHRDAGKLEIPFDVRQNFTPDPYSPRRDHVLHFIKQAALTSNYERTVSQSVIFNLLMETMSVSGSIVYGRRMTILANGLLAIVPSSTRPGDIICCLAGSRVPYVLRPCVKDDSQSDEDIYASFLPDEMVPPESERPGCDKCERYRLKCQKERPVCSSCQISNSECEYSDTYKYHDEFLTGPRMEVGHYKFIGECFVETLMFGWTAPTLEAGRKQIFAIH